MKAFFLIAAAASALVPAVASAQVDGTVDITGSVAGRCLFTTPTDTIDLGELALGGSDGQAGRLDASKVDGQTATLEGWCNNTSATITVTAKPLLNTVLAASGFDNRVDFTATADANEVAASDSSVGEQSAGDSENVGMFAGEIEVTLSDSSTPNGDLLVAGDYAGEVVVTLSPNVALPEA